MAAAPAVDLLLLLLLLVALLIIALLLLLPETHTTLECRAKGGLVRGAYLPRVDELVLPGRYPQLADRRLLNLLSYQPTVSANAPKASKVAHERVKRFWAERGRERGRVVGSKSVKEALWAQGAREVSKCYLDEEKHLDSPTLVDDDEEQTQGYSIWRETHRSMEFHTWIETAACQQQLLLS